MSLTPEQLIIAGNEAAQLLGSDTFRDAVQRVRDDIIAEWRSLEGPEKVAQREDAHRRYCLLEEVVSSLYAPVRDARMAIIDEQVN